MDGRPTATDTCLRRLLTTRVKVFLERAADLPACMDRLAVFARMSGLAIQPRKCVGLWLNTAIVHAGWDGVPFLRQGETTRYLGVLVGTGDLHDANWNRRVATLQTRMGRASQVTTGLSGRAMILRCIWLPGILFTANFTFPDASTIAALHQARDVFVWRGHFDTATDKGKKVPVAATVLQLPRREGGLGLPNVQDACETQAIRKVFRWATLATGENKRWGSLLLQLVLNPLKDPFVHDGDGKVYVTPRTRSVTHKQMGDIAVWGIGYEGLAQQLTSQFPVPAMVTTSVRAQWALWSTHDLVEWTSASTVTIHLPHVGRQEWITHVRQLSLAVPAVIRRFWQHWSPVLNPWVIDERGEEIAAAVFEKVPGAGWPMRLQQRRVFQFEAHLPGPPPMGTGAERRYRKKIDFILRVMLFNNPTWVPHVSYPSPRPQLTSTPPEFDAWTWLRAETNTIEGIAPTGERVTLTCHSCNLPPTRSGGPVLDPAAMQDANHLVLQADPHLHSCPFQEPAARKLRLKVRRGHLARMHKVWKTVRQQLRRKQIGTRGRDNIRARLLSWQDRNAAIAAALRRFKWGVIWRRASGLAEVHQVFRYRLCLGALNTRRADGQHQPWCPLEGCAGREVDDLAHVFWSCGVAQRMWRALLGAWEGTTADAIDLAAYRSAIFEERPPRVSAAWAQAFRQLYGDLTAPDRVHIKATWCTWVRVAQMTLWRHRCSSVHESNRPFFELVGSVWTAIHSTFTAQAEYAKSIADPRWRAYDLAARQYDGTTTSEKPTEALVLRPHPGPVTVYRLHYDGGARGNPGPSGWGAVLQAVHRTGAVVEWAAAGYIGTSTNNVAEYNGLLAGLRAVKARGITRLTVYGDSDLIRRQLQGDAGVGATLRHLHSAALALLDHLDFYICLHVRRQWNKAADALANLAMNDKCSYGGATAELPREARAALHRHTTTDAFWTPPTNDPPRLAFSRLYAPSQRRAEAARQGHTSAADRHERRRSVPF